MSDFLIGEEGTGSGRFDSSNDPVFVRVGICHSCKHNRKRGKCAAFPDGIPAQVLVGNVLHTRPISGDNGLQYEGIVL